MSNLSRYERISLCNRQFAYKLNFDCARLRHFMSGHPDLFIWSTEYIIWKIFELYAFRWSLLYDFIRRIQICFGFSFSSFVGFRLFYSVRYDYIIGTEQYCKQLFYAIVYHPCTFTFIQHYFIQRSCILRLCPINNQCKEI